MDPIADMICSINNAQAVGKKQVTLYPYSDFKYAILELLKNEGFVDSVEKKGRLSKRKIVIDLKYGEDGSPKIIKIRKISKQGQRIYSTYREMKPVKSGHGISIVTTSKGLLTNKEARKNKIGGEIICEIW
ncbi:MAG: 30S ribosomal protein S8 [Candidatus Pacebacteria bacterium]|jgi:small subunit ribosomal protein S8|nr:30S ribosomal protein S8 [Candidatus Paceibacterota bacterium]MDD2757333.1 30S ribosomal protein S8 [Candidatus Paceibacterota bacterium]MDD3283469.1 30S ribosomal protein S8 [Candidatus Paceibacterota bacterium]MDD3969675.1 30S ribosomal protein S8 [Candidatus Paceibacterota bacterium]MDD4737905.1 30S ribosomal protein S8 [Candidatus Paceibacterota bacterium]